METKTKLYYRLNPYQQARPKVILSQVLVAEEKLLIVISWVTHNVGIQSIVNISKMQHRASKLLPNECELSRFLG